MRSAKRATSASTSASRTSMPSRRAISSSRMSALAAFTESSRCASRYCFQSTPTLRGSMPCIGQAARQRSRCARSCAARPAPPAPRSSPCATSASTSASLTSRSARRSSAACSCWRIVVAQLRPGCRTRRGPSRTRRRAAGTTFVLMRLERDRVVDASGRRASAARRPRRRRRSISFVSPGAMPTRPAFRSVWLSAAPTSTSAFSSRPPLPPSVRLPREVEHARSRPRARRGPRPGRSARPPRAAGRLLVHVLVAHARGLAAFDAQALVVGQLDERQGLEDRLEASSAGLLVDLELARPAAVASGLQAAALELVEDDPVDDRLRRVLEDCVAGSAS